MTLPFLAWECLLKKAAIDIQILAPKFTQMQPLIDYIQITVKDLSESEPFYDQLMPILDFDINKKSKGRVEATTSM